MKTIKTQVVELRFFAGRVVNLCRSHKIYTLLAGILAILAVFIVSAGFYHSDVSKTADLLTVSPKSPNLIDGQDWSHFAGATQTTKGVQVRPLGRAIVNQDGSPNQLNPPVNVGGPHLMVSGDFKVTYKVRSIPANAKSSFYLYDSVPIIYDEWRMETPQLQINVGQNDVSVQIWDGSSDTSVDQKTWGGQKIGDNASVTISSAGGQISISLNSQKLGSIAGHDIFKSGTVWFGADATVGTSGWTLSYLAAEPLSGGQVKVVSGSPLAASGADSQALRSLSEANSRKLPIGAAVANYALFSDPDYRKLVATQFSMLTPENELKPQFVHPQPNVYSFSEADSLVSFAAANNMKVHGHTLVFSEANPKWMQDAPLADRQKVMTDHITTVMRHFGTKISEWDVVNEPLSDDDETLRNNIWFAAMGEKYIDTAFASAHAANPSAKLYINEYGLERDGDRWNNFLDLLNRLKARGVPIDGVGFQSHIYEDGDEVEASVIQKHIKTLADMGIISRISEVDAYGDSPTHQSDQYAEALRGCLISPTCTSFTTWGVTDRYGSTTEIHAYPLEVGNDLIWSSNLQPKMAYIKLQNELKK